MSDRMLNYFMNNKTINLAVFKSLLDQEIREALAQAQVESTKEETPNEPESIANAMLN